LLKAIQDTQPNVTAVSGDFVQNGTGREFEQARDFVRQLPEPRILVPGNHDMPFLNLLRRFTTGLRLYEQFITPDLEPFWSDNEIAIMGSATVRRWPVRGGRIRETQVRRVEERLCSLGPEITKILVTHHPFDLPPHFSRRELVGRARMAMGRLASSVDILLAGHMHVSHSGSTAVRYQIKGRSAIFVQAGTATSTRGRGEPNAFNILRIDRPSVVVERYQWQSEQGEFHCVSQKAYTLSNVVSPCALPSDQQAGSSAA
jgi:3',5'-cyclic AMP phosphodiesterase CpdA